MNQDACILSGSFSAMCGTTRDTLRYYESKGILVPSKDPDNGYKYYSFAQVATFYYISCFRAMGCSVEDIKRYIFSGKITGFQSLVRSQLERLVETRQEIERSIASLSFASSLLEQIDLHSGPRPIIGTLPQDTCLAVTQILSDHAGGAGEIASDIQRHIQFCEAQPSIATYPLGVCLRADDVRQGRYCYRRVFSFCAPSSAVPAERLVPLPSRNIVSCVFSREDADIREAYHSLIACAGENGWSLCSDIFSVSLVNVVDLKDDQRYLKYLFACICKP